MPSARQRRPGRSHFLRQQRVAALGGDQEAAWRGFTDRQPMGRLGRPEEIAALALYLASDESSFTTGTVHVVDGGWSN